jgi:hypothetical protein
MWVGRPIQWELTPDADCCCEYAALNGEHTNLSAQEPIGFRARDFCDSNLRSNFCIRISELFYQANEAIAKKRLP